MSVIIKRIERDDTSSNGLRQLLKYIEKPDAQQEASHDIWYFNTFDNKSAQSEMLAVNQCNPRATSTFEHLVISFDKEVYPSRSQALQSCLITLKITGLDKCLTMSGLHYDQRHIHIHMAIVTINPTNFKSTRREWFIESLHRAAAYINYIQNWEPQNKQIYSIIKNENKLVAVRNFKKTRTLKRNPVSTFQGEMSGKEQILEVVQKSLAEPTIHDWTSFHQYLSNNGVEYKAEKNGFVFLLHHEDKTIKIKASAISKITSANYLSKKFGKFNNDDYRVNKLEVIKVNAKPAMWMSTQIQADWRTFYQLKIEFNNIKNELKKECEKKRKILALKHKDARKLLQQKGWDGRMSELLSEMKSLGIRHRSEKLKLRNALSKQRDEFIKKYKAENGPTNNFNDYLKHLDLKLYEQYQNDQKQSHRNQIGYASARCVAISDTFDNLIHIPNYESEVKKSDIESNSIREYWNNDGHVDFVIKDNVIYLNNDYNEASVIQAFLRLASTKFKSFELEGSIGFQFQCAIQAKIIKIEDQINNLLDTTTLLQKNDNSKLKTNNSKKPRIGMRKIINKTHKSEVTKWDMPDEFTVIDKKEVKHKFIAVPASSVEKAINAYLLQAKNLFNKSKNDYFRDLEIAIRLINTGFIENDIAIAVNKASPLVLESDVHPDYSNHLIKVVNSESIKERWQATVELKKTEWNNIANSGAKIKSIY